MAILDVQVSASTTWAMIRPPITPESFRSHPGSPKSLMVTPNSLSSLTPSVKRLSGPLPYRLHPACRVAVGGQAEGGGRGRGVVRGQDDRQPAIIADGNRYINLVGHTAFPQGPVSFRVKAFFLQSEVQASQGRFVFKQVVDFLGRLKTVAGGNDEGDAPPVVRNDGGEFVPQGAKLKFVIPIAGPLVVGFAGDEVAPGKQFVPFDVGVVMDGPFIAAEGLGKVKGQPIKMGRAFRGVFGRQAIPAFLLHPPPILLIVHNRHQHAVIRVNDQWCSPQGGE